MDRKKIFISYGNQIYYDSLKRLEKMALETGVFDTVIMYTDKDLPDDIKQHPLMQYSRGGGYWLWKPYFTLKALKEVAGSDDIVIYSDSGNEVFAHREWDEYFEILKTHSAICFKYGDLMKCRTRKELLDAFADTCHNLPERYQIMSGLSLWSHRALPIVEEWYHAMFNHPEWVIDVMPDEMAHQERAFQEHRHDQAVLSCVFFKNQEAYHAKLMWQRCESYHKNGQAVFCARIANTPERKNGRPHKPRRLISRIRSRIRLQFRNLREYIYTRIL